MTTTMRYRRLGKSGPEVSAIGLGCMAMSEFYGPADVAASIRTIRTAIDMGVTLIDTAASYGKDKYGEGANEELVGRAIAGRLDSVVLATKVGIVHRGGRRVVDNSPSFIRRSVEESLNRLRVDHVDLLYLHRRNPEVPVEDAVGAMRQLVAAGKALHLGLSEVNAETLRRACEAHPIAALQSEYSLLSRELERDVIPVARDLGVGIVAYAPLGRALLTGGIESVAGLAPDDLRLTHPRFLPTNLTHNVALVRRIASLASDIGCTPAQLALAWLMRKGNDVVPVLGTSSRQHLRENVGALQIRLTDADVEAIEAVVPLAGVAGERNTQPDLARMGR